MAFQKTLPDKCIIEACDEPARMRSWCKKHYTRWYRTGNPLGSTKKPKKTEEEKRAYRREYRLKNQDRLLARDKAYYEANKVHRLDYMRRYVEAHPDRAKAWKRKYYDNNRATVIQRSALWALEHPERTRQHKRNWEIRNPLRLRPFLVSLDAKTKHGMRLGDCLCNEWNDSTGDVAVTLVEMSVCNLTTFLSAAKECPVVPANLVQRAKDGELRIVVDEAGPRVVAVKQYEQWDDSSLWHDDFQPVLDARRNVIGWRAA